METPVIMLRCDTHTQHQLKRNVHGYSIQITTCCKALKNVDGTQIEMQIGMQILVRICMEIEVEIEIY